MVSVVELLIILLVIEAARNYVGLFALRYQISALDRRITAVELRVLSQVYEQFDIVQNAGSGAVGQGDGATATGRGVAVGNDVGEGVVVGGE